MDSPVNDASQELKYYVLDVFTEKRLEGNPLAVFINPGTLTSEQMQAIARETNLSETVFVERRPFEIEMEEGIRARIFTTEEELPFAGHPTLGTASLLRVLAPEIVQQNSVGLALAVGRVTVRFEPQTDAADWPVRGEMTQRDPTFGETLVKSEVAHLLGLEEAALHPVLPVQIVSTGTAFAIVVLQSSEALARLQVRQSEATEYLRRRGARWFYVIASSFPLTSGHQDLHNEHAWRARMQFNGGEDPATGSAAGCAISYLVRHGVVASDTLVHLRQGIEIHRPSYLFLRAAFGREDSESMIQPNVTQVRVGGSTVLVATGRFFLP